ncbi:MAG: DUF3667 domain-containing protein [Pseudomonadota bacterium]
MSDAPSFCPNCGNPLAADDRFCSQCGQKVLSPEDRRLASLLKESIEEMTDLRGRVLPSIGTLLFRPGALARFYQIGRRRSFLAPISLFLFANVLYFLIPGLNDFQVSLLDQITLQPYSEWAASAVDTYLDTEPGGALAMFRNGDPAYLELSNLYTLRAADISKSIIILHVPFLAALTALLVIDKRLPYADHLVLALHYMAFIMLFFVIAPNVLLPLARMVINPIWPEAPLKRIIISLMYLYTAVMFRTAFQLPWWRVVPTTVVFLIGYGLIHSFYRLVQFFVVFSSL